MFPVPRIAVCVHGSLGLTPAVNGVLVTDGYDAYEHHAKKTGINHARCWAHGRRAFFKTSTPRGCRLLRHNIWSTLIMTLTPNSLITPQTPNRGFFQFVGTDQAQNTFFTLYSAGPNGSRCSCIIATSNDASTQPYQISWRIFDGTSIVTSFTFSFTDVLGFDGVPSQPLITPAITAELPVDQFGNQYIQLAAGDTVAVTYNGALSTSPLAAIFFLQHLCGLLKCAWHR